MKKISFIFTGVLTALIAVGSTGCSDNTDDRNSSNVTNPSQNEATRSSTAYSAGSGTGTTSSMGSNSGDVSSEYLLDPTGSGPGE